MSRVYICDSFPKSVSRVFNDVLALAACEAVDSPENADVQILKSVPRTESHVRTLIVGRSEEADTIPAYCTFLHAPFTLSRLMIELQAEPDIRNMPSLAHGWHAHAAARSFTHAQHASIILTEREWDMCVYLLQQRDTVSQEQLLQDLWGYDRSVESHTVETHMYRLRQKLEQHATPPLRIETTEGGYRAVTENA